jgi:thioredoxin-related protein
MKRILVFILILISFSFEEWHNNLDEAKQVAKKEHRHILLNFSGSDWCGPCIRMHREIFDQEVFKKMAGTQLVLVNADFPRMKKNQLPARQQELNEAMADQYDPRGRFPYTLLLNPDGKILKEWDGYPGISADAFTREVRNAIHADR